MANKRLLCLGCFCSSLAFSFCYLLLQVSSQEPFWQVYSLPHSDTVLETANVSAYVQASMKALEDVVVMALEEFMFPETVMSPHSTGHDSS